MVGIYKITSPSNKVYIGQSWNINNRKGHYKNGHTKTQPLINKSLLKYGFNNHTFEIIHELPIDTTQEVLDIYEEFY